MWLKPDAKYPHSMCIWCRFDGKVIWSVCVKMIRFMPFYPLGFLYVSVIRVLQENHTVKQGSNISIRTLVNIFVRIFGGQMCYKALTALLKCVKCVHLTWFCRVQHQIRFQREYNFSALHKYKYHGFWAYHNIVCVKMRMISSFEVLFKIY